MNVRQTRPDSGSGEWRLLTGPRGFFCTVVGGPDFGRVFALEKAETVIGRGDEADLQVSDEKVSRRHIRIELVHHEEAPEDPPQALMRDLGSKNGVRVNGDRVREQELRNGDKLQVGETILKFEVKDRLDVRYQDNLYAQATRDHLTGLCNRPYFHAEARKLAALGARYNRVFSLLRIDVDELGRINAACGREEGDRALKAIAATISHQLRSLDVAARLSGDEFAVLLPETPLGGALSVAERLRQSVAALDLGATGCEGHITISLGVSEFPASAVDLDRLVQRADDGLFQAKRNGRNRVCVARLAASAQSWDDDTKVR